MKSYLLEGGEPFLYSNIRELLENFSSYSVIPGIATNGTLLTDECCSYLKTINVKHNIYVSIDGPNSKFIAK